ncbi:MAG TPA: DNA topoisomerase IB [Jatrophihabitantaceae bacterium]
MTATASAPRRRKRITLEQIVELHEDAARCATAAGLRYVSADDPGIRRIKRGRGFSYLDADGRAVAAEVKVRIGAMAIPPAWTDVWICAYEDGHLLAIGSDDKGRRQYLYHDDWRVFRDLLNFYRLVDFAPRLPKIRTFVAEELRRRTHDRAKVLAAMLRIVDVCGLRVGSEEYAEENASYGLSTLTKKHVRVQGGSVHFDFPAKSGKQAQVRLDDRAVARVIEVQLSAPGQRLFSVGGSPISADELNRRLGELAGARVTAKDFRTWHGTRVAFASLRAHLPPGDDREQRVLDAIDAASDFLNNTRAIARGHYVHPHVVESYLDGSFPEVLALRRPPRAPGLDSDERALVGFLGSLLARHMHAI